MRKFEPGSAYNLVVFRSKRKTLSLEINDDLEPVVRAPKGLSMAYIERFVREHEAWIEKTAATKKQRLEKFKNRTPSELEQQREEARELLKQRVSHFGEVLGLRPAGMKITSAKKRYGSCSGSNSVCFSLYLLDYPLEAIDYVVVHELCHIRHKNHGAEFYKLIASVLPDYKERIKLLKKC